MRRPLRRSVLAAGGTLMAAIASRKWLLPEGRAEAAPALAAPGTIQPHPPTPLPPLSFTDSGGQTRTLEQLRAGRPVLLNLWATWCVPCVAEMPALSRLSAGLAGSHVDVLTVSLDHGGADSVRRFFAERGISRLPVLLDPHSTTLSALGLEGIPVSLLVDAQGREVARVQGSIDWAAPDAAAAVVRIVGI